MNRKLYRSRRFRVFGGVAGGLGTYFNIDPIIVRVIFVIVAFMHGLGLLGYIILWIVIPEEPFEVAYPQNAESGQGENIVSDANNVKIGNGRGSMIFGAILIGIGLLFLADRIFPRFSFDDFVPLLIVIIGGLLVWNSINNRGAQ